MSVKRIAKSAAIFICVFVLGFIFHTSVFGRIPIGVVVPNVLILFTSAFGFMQGGLWGMGFGFIAGILMDCYSPEFFGLNCLLFLLIGYINGLFTKLYFGDDIRLPLLLIGMSDVFYGLCMYAFLFLVRQRYDFYFYFMNIIMPEAVYTILVFMLLYYPLLRAFRWVEK